MREMKFRGKILEGYENAGNWFYFTLDDFIDSGLFGDCPDVLTLNCIDIKTVGQFTGLYDKNGTEIYEGDIVNNEAMVVFVDDKYCLKYLNKFKDWNGMPPLRDNWWVFTEITGNIYDNPELLKEGVK